MKNPTVDELLETIVQKRFEFTLKPQNNDNLDFHEVSVWGLKEVLIEVYNAGLKAENSK